MVFLAPLMLLGLLAALIPVAIHLIRRERPPKVVFGSIRFLKNTPKKLILFQRLQQLLLLLLRSLLLALLVLAFARPLFNQGLARLLDGDPQSAVIVLDATLSMRYAQNFPAAKTAALQAIDELGPSDEAALLILDEQVRVLADFTQDREALRRAVQAQEQASFGAASLSSSLQLADEMLAQAQFENRAVALVSDFQASALTDVDGSWKLAPGVALNQIDVGSADSENLSLVDLRVPDQLIAGTPVAPVLARIRSTGTIPASRARASLEIDGALVEQQEVEFDNVSERVVEFAVAQELLAAPGEHSVLVRVEGDTMTADNERYAVLAVAEKISVLVVNGESSSDWFDDEAHWLELAASAGPAAVFATQSTTPQSLTPAMLAAAEVVALLNVGELTPAQSSALNAFVARGGGLLVAPGDRAGLSGVAASLMPASLSGSPRLSSGDYRLVADFDRRHPLFARLDAEWASRFDRVWQLQPNANSRVLMQFDDAAPALIESADGRVLLTAMPMDTEWGDFPLQPLYLPFVHETLSYLAARALPQRSAEIGAPLPEGFGGGMASAPGLLSASQGAAQSTLLAVNADPTESLLARRAPSSVFDAVINPENESLAPREVRTAALMVELENPQRLWWWILGLVLLLLLAETFIANRAAR